MEGRPIFIVAGVGTATGTGAAAACVTLSFDLEIGVLCLTLTFVNQFIRREFSRALNYRVALVARRLKDLQTIADEINAAGGEAFPFPLKAYTREEIVAVFQAVRKKWPDSRIKAALWNASQWSRIPFLDVKEEDIQMSVQINIVAAFAWSQEAIKAMLEPGRSQSTSPGSQPGGTLLFTGATSSTRGAASFATFAAGKHGLRALSQSLAREFGNQGIHVAHVVIDGTILTRTIQRMFGGKKQVVQTPGETDDDVNWLEDPSRRLDPASIAKASGVSLLQRELFLTRQQAYVYLHQQDKSAWTLELDMRPAKEHF
ncbi:hypothetical protein FRC17_001757 [Serendipita sp. 399]|nr:hypothetical protein FRC17_001757 [Serendipita sp. 399]